MEYWKSGELHGRDISIKTERRLRLSINDKTIKSPFLTSKSHTI